MARRANIQQRTKNKTRRCGTSAIALFFVVCSLFLSGCLLTSGELASTDTQASAGNLSASFVSADGQDERTVDVGSPGNLSVIAIVSVAQGELRIDLLDPNGAVALSVRGRPNEQVTTQGNVQTDAEGKLRYRIVARGARSGNYQVLYQKAGT